MSEKQLNFLHIFSENGGEDKKIEAEEIKFEQEDVFDPHEDNLRTEAAIEAANQLAMRRHESFIAHQTHHNVSSSVSFAGLNSDEMAMKEGFSGNAGRVKRRYNSRLSTGVKSKARLTKWSKTDKRFGKDAAAGEALDL
ncbi:MAG: hypothetical protein EOM74_00620 [Methanomicrobia archaeon]|nr:hypothetical protein [Methanomicrobia archaeon]